MSIKEKILKGIELTANEVQDIIYEDCDEPIEIVDEEFDRDDHRWVSYVDVIIKINDRYFKIWWARGLTECQENEFEAQTAIEMELIKKVIYTFKEL